MDAAQRCTGVIGDAPHTIIPGISRITGCQIRTKIMKRFGGSMKRMCIVALLSLLATPLFAQQGSDAPDLKFESVPFLKITYDRNLGEVLGVAVNSKGHVIVLNHPGTSDSGAPIFGEATAQLLEYGPNGEFIRQVGKGAYGLAYAHSVRF